jgi:hypothetical protein
MPAGSDDGKLYALATAKVIQTSLEKYGLFFLPCFLICVSGSSG